MLFLTLMWALKTLIGKCNKKLITDGVAFKTNIKLIPQFWQNINGCHIKRGGRGKKENLNQCSSIQFFQKFGWHKKC